MLGIDSQISIQGDSSKISNQSQHLPLESKCTHSTKHISTVDDGSQNKCSEAKLTKTQKIKQLKKKLGTMEKNQQQIQEKLGSYVGVLEKELKKKEEHNRQLEECVGQLKKEIQQSITDVQVLLNYLAKKKSPVNSENAGVKPNSPNKNRKYVVSKGKSRSPVQKQEHKSPTTRKNKILIK